VAQGLRLLAPAELAEKVSALSRADIYGVADAVIERIETHMSWVFLTARHAYKLKKPVISDALDFSTLQQRHWFCLQELLLNRRLAPTVYLDVVALMRDASGRIHINGAGEIIDYLVKMRRLPAAQALDQRIARRRLTRVELRALAARLAAFYAQAERVAVTPENYRQQFIAAINCNRETLRSRHYALPISQIDAIAAAQLACVETDRVALGARARGNRIVDAHGDLRPEHIYLTDPVQIVDCLEFKRELRLLDPLHELAFLAMECARLGAPQCGKKLIGWYQAAAGEKAPAALIRFYQSHAVFSRAKIAIWHLDDPTVRNHALWRARARAYLDIAERALD
jgi:aminoglycoside phosphotransferase family enzyme